MQKPSVACSGWRRKGRDRDMETIDLSTTDVTDVFEGGELIAPNDGVVMRGILAPKIVPNLNYLVRCTCGCGHTFGLKMMGEGSWLIIADLAIRCDSCGYMFMLSKTNLSTKLGEGKG